MSDLDLFPYLIGFLTGGFLMIGVIFVLYLMQLICQYKRDNNRFHQYLAGAPAVFLAACIFGINFVEQYIKYQRMRKSAIQAIRITCNDLTGSREFVVETTKGNEREITIGAFPTQTVQSAYSSGVFPERLHERINDIIRKSRLRQHYTSFILSNWKDQEVPPQYVDAIQENRKTLKADTALILSKLLDDNNSAECILE